LKKEFYLISNIVRIINYTAHREMTEARDNSHLATFTRNYQHTFHHFFIRFKQTNLDSPKLICRLARVGWFGIGRLGVGWLGVGGFGVGWLGVGGLGVSWLGVGRLGVCGLRVCRLGVCRLGVGRLRVGSRLSWIGRLGVSWLS
jgi:hypothetical protein